MIIRPLRSPSREHYPATLAEVMSDLKRMRREPVTPPRPIVVLGGFHSPPTQAGGLRREIVRRTSSETRTLSVSFFTMTDLGAIIERASRRIRETFGEETVDLVGISMGGLIARAIACTTPIACVRDRGVWTGVNAARIFTLASPHRGARLADRVRPTALARDLRAGSPFLRSLDERMPDTGFELTCYSRLGDGWVGATRAAPAGRGVIWVSGGVLSHFSVSWEPRVIADLCRRLRGEEPLGRPSAPPCD